MALQIIVRLARNEDLLKRQELVRQGFAAHNWSAFWYFFLQELTLECCVLGAAVLFIFFGVSVSACLTLVPAAAAFVALVVYCSHYALAQKHAQSLNNEMFGVVAEIKGGLLLTPQQANPIYFQFESMEKESLNQSSEYSHVSNIEDYLYGYEVD